MTDADKKFAAFCFGTAAMFGVFALKLKFEQRKIDKRMKRNSDFLLESEALKVKHQDAGTLHTKEHSNDLIALMNHHGL